jgi:hypothetical protein
LSRSRIERQTNITCCLINDSTRQCDAIAASAHTVAESAQSSKPASIPMSFLRASQALPHIRRNHVTLYNVSNIRRHSNMPF